MRYVVGLGLQNPELKILLKSNMFCIWTFKQSKVPHLIKGKERTNKQTNTNKQTTITYTKLSGILNSSTRCHNKPCETAVQILIIVRNTKIYWKMVDLHFLCVLTGGTRGRGASKGGFPTPPLLLLKMHYFILQDFFMSLRQGLQSTFMSRCLLLLGVLWLHQHFDLSPYMRAGSTFMEQKTNA